MRATIDPLSSTRAVADGATPGWRQAVKMLGLALCIGCGGVLEGDADAQPEGPDGAEPEAAAVAAPSRAGLFRRGADALVRIETPHRIGAGFVAATDGIVITRYALLENERVARVVLPDGRTLEAKRVLAAEPELDVAVLSVEADGLTALDVAMPASPPTAGDPVFTVGHALGMSSATLAEGVVGDSPRSTDAESFLIAAPVPDGFVGAPVLDARGQVLGLVTGEAGEVTSVAPATRILALLGGVDRGGGETMDEFGARTRRESGWTDLVPPIEEAALADCSGESREWMWLELQRALEIAVVIDGAGACEPAFRVLEGAVLRLSADLRDCRELLEVLDTVVDVGRAAPTPHPALDAVAESFENALELLFEAPTDDDAADVPIAAR